MDVPARFGDVLRELRRTALLSQEELARRAGLTARALSNLERGRAAPRASSVRLLAEALRLTDADRRDLEAAAGAAAPPTAAAPATARAEAPLVPAQLPGDAAAFVGRWDELAVMDSVTVRPGPVVIGVISGMPGVGKTALAVHWAHGARHSFPDGQIFLNLRGHHPAEPMHVGEALGHCLRSLGWTGPRLPSDVDERAALLRSLLTGRRVLIILDNVASVEQVRPLLPGSASCAVWITSRDSLAGLVARHGAYRIDLDTLHADDAVELLRAVTGGRIGPGPGALRLAEQCARLPLALRVAAELDLSRPERPLSALIDDLDDRGRRLDLLDADGDPGTAVRAVFSWSYHHLSGTAARLFTVLGLHPGPTFGVPAATALIGGGTPAETARLLDRLTRAHLVRAASADVLGQRFEMHDLLHEYAAERASADLSADDRRSAVARLLDFHVHSAYAADRLLNPHRTPVTLPVCRPGVAAWQPRTADEAHAWFVAECPALLSTVAASAAAGHDAHTRALGWALSTFLDRQGHWEQWVATQVAALDATRRLNDRREEARARCRLAAAYCKLGRHADADHHQRQALHLFAEMGCTVNLAHAQLNMAWLQDRRGRHTDAHDHLALALRYYRAAGHTAGEARTLNATGWYHAKHGDFERALTCCRQAADLQQEIGDQVGLAATLDSLGYIHRRMRRLSDAIACYERSVALRRGLCDRNLEAMTLASLGDTYRAAGRDRDAEAAQMRAADLSDHVGGERRQPRAEHIGADA